MEFYMKVLNKLLSVGVASVLVFSLAGCGDKEETKTFNANINGADIKITYTYEGDKVLKQTSENKINYSTIGAKNKEEAEKILEPLSAKYKDIKGVDEKITYNDTWAEESVTVDMEKVDFKALQNVSGSMVTGDTSKGVSMKQTETMLESAGFKEVK